LPVNLSGRASSLAIVAAFLAGIIAAGPVQARESPLAVRSEALDATSGSFLAAMSAQGQRDLRAAARYYRDVLQARPDEAIIAERAFIAELGDGNIAEAIRYAERGVKRGQVNSLARATLGVRDIKQRRFASARQHLARASGGRGRNSDLTVALLTAWTHVGSGDLRRALEIVDQFNAPELTAYRNFFGGLMADVAGDRTEAAKRLTAAYRSEPGTLRVADAFARLQSRLGNREDAIKVYGEWENRSQGQPFVARQLEDLRAGRALPPLATTVAEGASEVLYGLGATSGSSREADTSLVFLQLASYLDPDDDLITVSIAEVFEQMRQWERAADAFGRIGAQSPYRIRSLLGRVIAYERMERTDEAIATLTTLVTESPKEYEAVDMLGGLYRTKKKFEESIAVYSRAINALEKPERAHWALFFGRGVAYERNKQWLKGEPDFIKALELLPAKPRMARERYERAQVLNYLGYSWVDQGMNIEQSFDMLKEAVALAPDDGAIVDSLGWAYYRLDRFDDAVRELERAIELKPGDPTINDHLGDAYWQVGRTREAYFKWTHARDLKPEPEDLPRILTKLVHGLDEPPPVLPPELDPGLPDFGKPGRASPPIDRLPSPDDR